MLWKRIAMKELRPTRIGRRVDLLASDMDKFLGRDNVGQTKHGR